MAESESGDFRDEGYIPSPWTRDIVTNRILPGFFYGKPVTKPVPSRAGTRDGARRRGINTKGNEVNEEEPVRSTAHTPPARGLIMTGEQSKPRNTRNTRKRKSKEYGPRSFGPDQNFYLYLLTSPRGPRCQVQAGEGAAQAQEDAQGED
jgi:hypothetical protein